LQRLQYIYSSFSRKKTIDKVIPDADNYPQRVALR
jgi:hypothetical protein